MASERATAEGSERGPILAPVDFSPNSVPSAVWALLAARHFERPLLILHVVHDPAEDPGSYLKVLTKDETRPAKLRLMDQAAAAAEVLERFLIFLQDHHPNLMGSVNWKSRLVEGRPGPRILEVAEEIGASLIVVGSHGRSGLSGLIVGSKAEQILNGTKIAVAVIKDQSEWL